MDNIAKAKEILEKYDQKHVITVMEKLSKEKQEKLANQVLLIDFEELKELYESTYEDIYNIVGDIKPVKATNPKCISDEEKQEYIKLGKQVVKNKKFAVVIMAGGQGTRLRTFRTKRNI